MGGACGAEVVFGGDAGGVEGVGFCEGDEEGGEGVGEGGGEGERRVGYRGGEIGAAVRGGGWP